MMEELKDAEQLTIEELFGLGNLETKEEIKTVDLEEKELNPADSLNEYTKYDADIKNVESEIEEFKNKHREIFNMLDVFNNKITEIKNKQAEAKLDLLKGMEEKELKHLENNFYKVTYVAPTTKKTFDTTRFKKEHTDLYEQFVKVSDVASYLRITEVK